MNEENILETILAGQKITPFSQRWVRESATNGEEMQSAHTALREFGLTKKRIASRANLLGSSAKTLKKRHRNLLAKGLTREKIAARPELLARDTQTINGHYQHHVGLLGKKTLTTYAQLLGITPETIAASVGHLYSLNIPYEGRGVLLGTRPHIKREKMAWLLREVFDYRTTEDKRTARESMYRFVQNNPSHLTYSIPWMERNREKLRKKAGTSSAQ